MLATFPTEPTQVQLGLWSVVWGVIVGVPASHTFALAPHAYAWMEPFPAWAWGAAWAAKGVWQAWAALALARARTFWTPDLARAQAQCLLAARVNVNLDVALALGFWWHLGPLNVYVAFYIYRAVLHGWVLRRAAQERRAQAASDQAASGDHRQDRRESCQP